jgi:hypothetical protein
VLVRSCQDFLGGRHNSSWLKPANAVRFRKQLSFQPPVNHIPTVSFPNEAARLASEKERTVFVIRAEYLTEFLVSFRLPPSLPDRP